MLATAGSAKKDMAKTEKQEATIFPGSKKSILQVIVIFILESPIQQETKFKAVIKISYLACPCTWHSVSVPNCCHCDLEDISWKYFPISWLSTYKIVVTLIWNLFPILYLENISQKYFLILWLSECCVSTPYSIIVTVTGARRRQKKNCTLASLTLFRLSVCVCCCGGNWYLEEPPEMSLTAFYNLLQLNKLPSFQKLTKA